MKIIPTLLAFFLIAGCAHTSTTSESIDINGLWKGVYQNPKGGPGMRYAFNFVRDGEKLKGAMRNETMHSEWIPMENFKIKGDRIYFITSFSRTPQGKIKYIFKGKIEEDDIKVALKIVPKDAPRTSSRQGQNLSIFGGESQQVRSGKGGSIAPSLVWDVVINLEFDIQRSQFQNAPF